MLESGKTNFFVTITIYCTPSEDVEKNYSEISFSNDNFFFLRKNCKVCQQMIFGNILNVLNMAKQVTSTTDPILTSNILELIRNETDRRRNLTTREPHNIESQHKNEVHYDIKNKCVVIAKKNFSIKKLKFLFEIFSYWFNYCIYFGYCNIPSITDFRCDLFDFFNNRIKTILSV